MSDSACVIEPDIMKNLTLKQKQALAVKLITKAGDLVEYWGEGTGEMEGVSAEQVGQQLSIWLKGLPGNHWDMRLPQP